MDAKGMEPTLVVEDATDREVFEAYVEEVLAPSLRSGQIVVMNSLTAHKGDCVRELIEERSCALLYFSKIKGRSEEHTSELQSRQYLVCRLLLEKNNNS